MPEGDKVRIELGFEGGQILSAVVAAHAAELERALDGGNDGAYGIDGDGVRYTILLRRVDYMKRFAREARVGFGAASSG